MISKMELDNIEVCEPFVITNGANNLRCKLGKDGSIFVYKPRCTRRGWRYNKDAFICNFDDYKIKSFDEAADWQKRVKKAIKRLEASGLWTDVLEMYKNLITVPYEDYKEVQRLDFKWEKSDEDKEKLREFSKKYPFMFDGEKVEYRYISEISDPKFKSMYFGRCNSICKRVIKNALEEKKKVTETGRTSYDVTFSYYPDDNSAFYREEYKDTGNGYYYIAIDHNTAIFEEKD